MEALEYQVEAFTEEAQRDLGESRKPLHKLLHLCYFLLYFDKALNPFIFVVAGLGNIPVSYFAYVFIAAALVSWIASIFWIHSVEKQSDGYSSVEDEGLDGNMSLFQEFAGTRTSGYFSFLRCFLGNPILCAASSSICVFYFSAAFNSELALHSLSILNGNEIWESNMSYLFTFLCILINIFAVIILFSSRLSDVLSLIISILKLIMMIAFTTLGLIGSDGEIQNHEAEYQDYAKLFFVCLLCFNEFSITSSKFFNKYVAKRYFKPYATFSAQIFAVAFGIFLYKSYRTVTGMSIGVASDFVARITQNEGCRMLTDFSIGLMFFGLILRTAKLTATTITKFCERFLDEFGGNDSVMVRDTYSDVPAYAKLNLIFCCCSVFYCCALTQKNSLMIFIEGNVCLSWIIYFWYAISFAYFSLTDNFKVASLMLIKITLITLVVIAASFLNDYMNFLPLLYLGILLFPVLFVFMQFVFP